MPTAAAYPVPAYLNARELGGGGRVGRPRVVFNPVSMAGLLAVILVMAGAHVVVARYDLIAMGALDDPCIFLSQDTTDTTNCDNASPSPSGSTEPTDEPIDSATP